MYNSGMNKDARLFAPAAARNRDVILSVLGPRLPKRGHVLEVASGSGEHICHFAAAYPALTFQPSDPDPDNRSSIDAWTRHFGLGNVAPAIALDATQAFAPHVSTIDVIICINMIHISPWAATTGLFRNAAAALPVSGLLYLYGPYRCGGMHTAPSNEDFDANLRSRNSNWGIRDLEAVAELAAAVGFGAPEITKMPANNLSLVFERG
jgi:hypothetical protein